MVIDEDYFIKYLKNELTEEETRRLIAWVKEKKENQDFLFSLKDSYVYLNYESDCKGVNTEHEWQKFAQKVGLSCQKSVLPKKNLSWKRFLFYAAAIIIVAFTGWQANFYYSEIMSVDKKITLETEVGQQARAVLPDGSIVLLNACSKLTYSLGEWLNARSVQLDGEAIFDVKHRDNEPFYVRTRHYNIRVLGTNFNVLSYPKEPKDIVTLKHGKVEIDVEGIADNITLKPGDSFIYP